MDLYQMNDIDIDNFDNQIPYTNENMKNYINIILKKYKCNEVCANEVCVRMTINFYQNYGPIRIIICAYNSNDVKIATVDHCESWDKHYQIYFLCRYDNEWNIQNIKKNDIIKEYKRMKEEIIDKYF